jgi:hypothetical protein
MLVFYPSDTSCPRLVNALLVEICEFWETGRVYSEVGRVLDFSNNEPVRAFAEKYLRCPRIP